MKFGGGESEGGQKFLPPNPLPFCPPERSVWRAERAVSSVQKMFEQSYIIPPHDRADIPVSNHPCRFPLVGLGYPSTVLPPGPTLCPVRVPINAPARVNSVNRLVRDCRNKNK